MSKQPRNARRAFRVFIESNGHGPWPCYWKDGLVERMGQATRDGNIHHLDGDALNDVPENLVVGHTDCHQRAHPNTDEIRAKISATMKGRTSPMKGRTQTVEARAKIGAAVSIRLRQRTECPDCGSSYNDIWMKRHVKEGKCTKR